MFNNLNYDLTVDLLSIPTVFKKENKVRDFIIEFAISNSINYEVDKVGNLYLTKGNIGVYPCLTAHMDSVQNHDFYIDNDKRLPVKITEEDNKVILSCDDKCGLGCDDKCGIAVALSVMQKIDNCKCAFFVEEEIGCQGSKRLDESFFENVGFVIGLDSPELNRAAHSCGTVQLFTSDFHKKFLKETCEKWGLKNFYSEPFTDIMVIKKKVNVQCMNFGVGYYKMHTSKEYCVVNEMDSVCGMCIDIINLLGYKKYTFSNILAENTVDEKRYLASLGDNKRYNVSNNDAVYTIGDVMHFLYKKENEICENIFRKCLENNIDPSIFEDCF